MYRLRGASEVIREASPPFLADVMAVVTELGGLAFLLVALSMLYWVDDRKSTATIISYTLVALVVTLALKQWFAFPRPPASVRTIAEAQETSGFPSGHAISSTVVYGGIVLARERLRDARYVVAAGSLIALVGLSRVVIGVHYLGDVLAGYAVGAVILGGLWFTVGHRAEIACLVAGVIALLTFPVISGSGYALLAVGGSFGGAAAFWSTDLGRLPRPETAVQTAVFVAAGLAFAGVTYWLTRTLTIAPLVLLVSAALVAGILLFPRALATRPFASLAE